MGDGRNFSITAIHTTNIIIMYYFIMKDLVAELCTEYFQRFRRQTHVTPKSYLSFLAGYKTIYNAKREEIGVLAKRMDTGILMLDFKCVTSTMLYLIVKSSKNWDEIKLGFLLWICAQTKYYLIDIFSALFKSL